MMIKPGTYKPKLIDRGEWDIVVAGAGPAGAAAALEAGRSGARVLLVDGATRVGGMGTSGLVSAFSPMSDGIRCVAGGIARELVETLYARGATGPHVSPEFWTRAVQRWIPFRPEELALLYDELLAAAGIEVRFGCRIIDALHGSDGPELEALVGADVEGLSVFRGRAFVDATGDAAVTAAAGFPVRRAGVDTPRIMPPTLCALVAGIEWDRIRMSPSGNCPDRQQELLENAITEGRFPRNDRHLPGLYRIGNGLGMMNAGHLFGTDALSGSGLSAGFAEGRRLVREYLEFYRTSLPGCENSVLVSTAPLLGIRESRRIQGEAELCYADYQARRRFSDGIGLCAGTVDIHVYDESPEEYERYHREFGETDRMGHGDSFGIPYRVLVPEKSVNLWVAGRCVSSDLKVHGALRIQPAAAVMGQAAGLAAFQFLQTGRGGSSLDTGILRRGLAERGAVLD